jgi:conjugal transfer pilus assembly protein TraW
MKFKYITIFAMSIILANAEDLGVVGKTYPIIEPDMIDVIKAKAKYMIDSGQWAEIESQAIIKAKQKVNNPDPVVGITHTNIPKTMYFDPRFQLKEDLTDGKGKIIAKAGWYNPLNVKPFNTLMIFIDGNSKAQVIWALNKAKESPIKTKIILTSGSFINLDKEFKTWFYYDQGGTYTTKLNIKHVPAIAYEENKQIRVDEIVVEDK